MRDVLRNFSGFLLIDNLADFSWLLRVDALLADRHATMDHKIIEIDKKLEVLRKSIVGTGSNCDHCLVFYTHRSALERSKRYQGLG